MARTRIIKGGMAHGYILFRDLDQKQMEAKSPQTRLPVTINSEDRYEVVPDGWTDEQLVERLKKIHGIAVVVRGERIKDKQ